MKTWAFILFFITIYSGYSQYDKNPNTYRFKYKSEVFKGSRVQITDQLRAIKNDVRFDGIPQEMQGILNKLFKNAAEQPIRRLYKEHAVIFLEALYGYEDFVLMYNNKLSLVITNLKKDMKRLDFKFEREFTKAKIKLDRTKKEDPNNTTKIDQQTDELYKSQIKLISHRWMKKKFDTYNGMQTVKNPDALIKEFKRSEAMNVYNMYSENKTEKIPSYLVDQIIDFFHSKALIEMDLEQLKLNYITRI